MSYLILYQELSCYLIIELKITDDAALMFSFWRNRYLIKLSFILSQKLLPSSLLPVRNGLVLSTVWNGFFIIYVKMYNSNLDCNSEDNKIQVFSTLHSAATRISQTAFDVAWLPLMFHFQHRTKQQNALWLSHLRLCRVCVPTKFQVRVI